LLLGEKVSLNQAIIVTIFSMGIVFLALLAISYILDGFRFAFYDKGKKEKQGHKAVNTEKHVSKEINTSDSDNNEDEELIAVITTAVAASLSKPTYSIKIKKIKRIPQSSSPWVNIGRQELMN
jgi:sodium pump decarboxylase gamma subunit